MKKITVISLCLVLLASFVTEVQKVCAVPARPVVHTWVQPDGTILTYRLCGDEWFHYYITDDGIPLVKTGDTFCYAKAQNGALVSTLVPAHNFSLRQSHELTLAEAGKQEALTLIGNKWNNRRETAAEVSQRKPCLRRAMGVPHTTTGKKRGLVILMEYPDRSFSSAPNNWYRQFNEGGYSDNGHKGSVRDYFLSQSYGQLTIDFDVVGPYMAKKNLAYYGTNVEGRSDNRVCTLIAEACRQADADVNYADYDWDGDGWVDQVFVISAGYSEAHGAGSEYIWPHEWHLQYGTYYNDGEGALKLDGVTVDNYAVSTELRGISGTNMDCIGTAVHEFSHCMGLPDLYDVGNVGNQTVGSYDILDQGSYAGPDWSGNVPVGYSAYERWFSGWLEFTELKADEPCKVTGMPCVGDTAMAYIMYSEGNRNEYYILENRQNRDFFTYPANTHGLMITHIDYDYGWWTGARPNCDPNHPRVIHIPADNSYDFDPADFFPGSQNVRTFNNTSHTKSYGTLYSPNADGTYNMNMNLTSIRELNGKINFTFNGGETAARKKLTAFIDQVSPLLDVPHADSIEGNTDKLRMAIEEARVIEGIDTTSSVYNAAIEALRTASIDFIFGATPTDPNMPFDVTFTLKNADVSSNDAWQDQLKQKAYTVSSSCGEYVDQRFTLSQTTPDLPKGDYIATCQGFQRPGDVADCIGNSVNCYFFVRNSSVKLHHIADEAKTERFYATDIKLPDNTFIPKNAGGARKYFDNEMYVNALEFNNARDMKVKIGIRCTVNKKDYWTCFDNFRLYYYGTALKTGINTIKAEDSQTTPVVYDLNGRRIDGKNKGVQIINGRKVLVR